MKTKRIRSKVLIGFACVVGIIALQGGVEYWRSTRLEILLRDVFGSSFKADVSAGRMLQAATTIRLTLDSSSFSRDKIEKAFRSLKEDVFDATNAAQTAREAALRLNLSARASEEQREEAQLSALSREISNLDAEWQAQLARGQAGEISKSRMRQLLDESILPELTVYALQSEAHMAGVADRALRMVTSSQSFLPITITMAIVTAVAASFLLARRFVSPLEKLVVAMERIARGERELRISLPRHDEFGRLAETFNKMLDSLQAATTARLQLEATVTERTQELDQFFTLSHDLLCIADFSGKFLRVNPAFEKVLGYSAEELVSRPFSAFIHPDDQAATAAEMAKFRSSGKPSIHFENRYRCSDGSWKQLSWNATPTMEANLVFAVARDVTEIRLAERALRESEQSLSITLQSIGDGVLVTDAQGQISRMNPIAEALTGWTLQEAKGRPIADIFHIVHETTRAPAVIPVEEVLATGHIVELANHTALIARDGSERSIADSAAPIRDKSGLIVGVVLVFRDVTRERIAHEEEKRRHDRIARFQRTILTLRDAESRDLAAFFQQATEECAQSLEVERVSIWLYDLDHTELSCADLYERTQTRHSSGARLPRKKYPTYFEALAQLQSVVADDVSTHPATRCLTTDYLVPTGIFSMLDVPIRSSGRLVGVMCCEHMAAPRTWSPEEVKFANSIAGTIMLAIEHDERIAAEAKLRESEEYNRSIVQSSEDCLKILSLEGELLQMAEHGQRMMEVDDFEKIRGSDWVSLWPKGDQAATRQALEDARSGGTGRYQGFCPTMAGKARWWDVVISAIHDPEGRPVRLLAVSRDISRQREIEETLRDLNETLEKRIKERTEELAANERKFRSMVEQVEDYAIFTLDTNGIVASWNAGAQRAKGYAAQEIIGCDYSCFYQKQDVENGLPQRLLNEAARAGHVRYEGWRVRKNGSVFWAETGITAIREAGELKGFIKVTRDLSERRQAELALREALENQRELTRKAQAGETAKSEFLAIMSHEVRTPMNGIIGYADLLAQAKDLSPENREYANILHHSGRALLRILDDILDFSSIEAGTLSVERVPFSIRRVLSDIRTLLAPGADQKGLTLELKMDPALPERVIGDPGRLRQVILNLAGNALKFTEIGSVTISVFPSDKEPGSKWRISVRDTGPGVPVNHRDAIFAPFIQADAGSSRRHGGTGLGLAISKRLAELLGGTLSMRSEAGIGSEFLLELPIEAASTSSNSAATASTAASYPLDGKFALNFPLTILVVEDDRVNMKLTLTLLRKLGYDPSAATNGLEAVEMFRAERPMCILMDLQMPEMGGIDATRAIRKIEQSERIAPVFIAALTANTVESDRNECFHAGMNDYLNKPIRRDSLSDLLARISKERAAAVPPNDGTSI